MTALRLLILFRIIRGNRCQTGHGLQAKSATAIRAVSHSEEWKGPSTKFYFRRQRVKSCFNVTAPMLSPFLVSSCEDERNVLQVLYASKQKWQPKLSEFVDVVNEKSFSEYRVWPA